MSSSPITTPTAEALAAVFATVQADEGSYRDRNSPYWLTRPCPPWCVQTHLGTDVDSDRACRSDPYTVGLTLENRLAFEDGRHEPSGKRDLAEWAVWLPDVTVVLRRGYREIEARAELTLTCAEAPEGACVEISLTELASLRDILSHLIEGEQR